MTRPSVRASAPATRSSARSGVRTLPRPPRRTRDCRPSAVTAGAGCWCPPPMRRNSARSWSRSSAARCLCQNHWLNFLPDRPNAPRSTPNWHRSRLHCGRDGYRRVVEVDEIEKLPPTAWVLIGAAAAVGFGVSWVWRWYRQYSARKSLRQAVTAAGSDHAVDALVPDGMGGGFHVDFLLLTSRGVLVIDLRDVQGNIFGGDQMAE